MFSKACEYGIRAIIFIVAKSRGGQRVGIKEICNDIDAPEPFTAKILQNLSRMGLISSIKGPNGGFYIAEDAPPVLLIDVVNAIDGDKIFTGCGLGLKECSAAKPCPIHYQFKSIRDALHTMLSDTTIQDLTKDLENGLAFLKR